MELADMHGESVVTVSDLEGTVTASVEGEEFIEDLSKLLAGTPYRHTSQAGYYLIGEFEPDEGSYAQAAERRVYEPRYLTAERLKQMLNAPSVEIKILSEKDYLMLRGLPEDIDKAFSRLEDIDSEDNPYQIDYRLTVVDISGREVARRELDRAVFSPEPGEVAEFTSTRELLEIAAPEILEELNISAFDELDADERVARPALVTELGETGMISLSEEIVAEEAGEVILEQESFTLEITPEQIDKEDFRVATEVDLSAGGSTDFNTTTWLEAEEDTMLGLMSLKQSQRSASTLSHATRQEERQFAVYLSAGPRGTLETADTTEADELAGGDDNPSGEDEDSLLPSEATDIADLDGMHDLLLGEEEARAFRAKPNYIQAMASEEGLIEVDAFWESDSTQQSFRLSTRRSEEYVRAVYEYPLVDLMKISAMGIFRFDEYDRYTLGLTDRSEFSPDLWLEAGYYPYLYQPGDGESETHLGMIQMEYTPGPIMLNLTYNYGLETEPLKAQAGINLTSSLSVVGSAYGYLNYLDRFLFGLRFEF